MSKNQWCSHSSGNINVKLYYYTLLLSIMTFVSVLIISLTCIVINYFILNHRRQSKTVKPLQGPKVFPFIGNAYCFLQRNSNGVLGILNKLTKNYSSPLQIWLGNKLFVGICEPDQIMTILQSNHCLNKGKLYEFLAPIVGTGLLTAPASTWFRKRKMIASSLNKKVSRDFFDSFVQESLILANKLETVGPNGNEIDLFNDIFKSTLKIAFGINTELEANKIDYCLKVILRIKKALRYRWKNIFMYSDVIFNMTALGRQYQKNINSGHAIFDEIIQQQMNALNKKDTTENKDKTFFEIIMEATRKEPSAHEHLRFDVFTLITTASDTTAFTINFVIFMLANFPEIQERAYKELLEIYGTETPKFAPVKYADLSHMIYLDCVIKETMRLFPPGSIIGRYLTKDVEMGEFILPKGADVFVPLIKLHRDEKYWSNPLVFDPDRFLPENIVKSYSRCYIPFSNGRRNCVGMKYAMISMKVSLATLLRTFIFKVDKSVDINEIKLSMDVLLYAVKPLKVKIEKRESQ